MVAGKVKSTLGFQRSPANPKPDPSPTTTKIHQKGSAAAFSRSFGVYFPRASAQVQPPPPEEVTELLQLVEQLRERESRLQTQLLEQKVVVKSSAFVPVFEDDNITKQNKKIECLEMENMALRQEVESLHCKLSEQRRRSDEKMKAMEILVSDLKNSFHHASFVSNTIIKNPNAKKNVVFLDKCNNIARNNKDENNHKTEREKDIEEALVENAESITATTERSYRVARIPKPPPPKRLLSLSSVPPCLDGPALAEASVIPAPAKAAPPPPPPPVKGVGGKVRRVPEVVEFYHSLMRRDSRRDSGVGATAANARDMIGEIENRSAYLTAIKTDVETQGDFIRFLIKEVESATFTDIQDVVSFVKWLDDELSYLMDERAVLKHFQWPEQKADTLREAAFGFCDLKKLESEASSFRDDNRHSCAVSLKKMQALFEKLEHGVYNMSRTRESAAKRYKGFHIPMDWMLDSGCVCQIKLASVKLAMKYMKRVSAEVKTGNGCPEEEELIVQGVRFAFRVHQFAGGFDEETMRAFQELREKARSCTIQCQNQQQKKDVCRPFGY